MNRFSLAVVLTGAILLAIGSTARAQTDSASVELANPLVTPDGRQIDSKDVWSRIGRPDFQFQFRKHMYGDFPKQPKERTAKLLYENAKAFGGKATIREYEVRYRSPDLTLHLLTAYPNASKTKRSPTFVGLNFCGNHAIVDDAGVRLPTAWMYPKYPGVVDNKATDAGRGKQADVWPIEKIVDQGYGLVTFYNGDVAPDRPESLDQAKSYFETPEQAKNVGMVAVWAWGVHRAIDFMVEQPEIDPKQIIAVGHSRLGKATLVAAAFDERIAIAMPHQAGCGGTAPSRGKIGESVQQINDRFPHWFNSDFKRFNQQTDKLPFDQHHLVALVAPRPVLFTNAEEDQWANPSGQFEVLKAANPVYKLFGSSGTASASMPKSLELLDGDLGYWIRPGKHSMTVQDWDIFLKYADKHLK